MKEVTVVMKMSGMASTAIRSPIPSAPNRGQTLIPKEEQNASR